MSADQPKSRRRLLWYYAGLLQQAGGGERLIMEGLRRFESRGIDARLLLHDRMPDGAAFFDGAYSPRIMIVGGDGAGGRLGRARALFQTIGSFSPDVLIANDPDSCRRLVVWAAVAGRLPPAYVTFVHGSLFQFADDTLKYARIFRRHVGRIRDADPVYREMIPVRPAPMAVAEAIRNEREAFMRYLSLRRASCIFTHSLKNQAEARLLYGSPRVEVVSAGGFNAADFGYRRRRDMKARHGLAGRSVLLSVCRLIPKKRVDLSVRGFAAAVRKRPGADLALVVGGTGPEEGALRELVRAEGMHDRVLFAGYIPEKDLKDWYTSCDAFISTDNADHDLSVASAWPLGCKVVITTQYEVPACLFRMRRFVFAAPPTPAGLAAGIGRALRAKPAPPGPEDRKELDPLTWERYFDEVLRHAAGALGRPALAHSGAEHGAGGAG